jgi:hypothetical protein
MWPFKKEPSSEPTASEATPNVAQGFGIFSPLFAGGGYLKLLNLQPDAAQAISLIMKCCAAPANPYPDICRMLRDVNWRPHLVGAVAIATLASDSKVNDELWTAIDRGSWVTPQLVAVAFLRDPMFADRAQERLRPGYSVDTSRLAGLSSLERHSFCGPGGSVERSAKTAASLVRLLGLLPQRPDWLIEVASSAAMANLLDKDIDS